MAVPPCLCRSCRDRGAASMVKIAADDRLTDAAHVQRFPVGATFAARRSSRQFLAARARAEVHPSLFSDLYNTSHGCRPVLCLASSGGGARGPPVMLNSLPPPAGLPPIKCN